MIINTTKNAMRNMVFGIVEKFNTLLFPFVIRTILIYTLGSLYLGLNGLFSSVLSFLSISELGIGSAIVYSMYKPISEDDEDTICSLLKFYKKLYVIVGLLILVIGLGMIPFLGYIIKGEVPSDVNIYYLYLIYLLNSTISYWMFSYKSALFTAYQRVDVISKITTVVNVVIYILQIIALFLFKNYYSYIVWLPVGTLAINIAEGIISKKVFPNLEPRGFLNDGLKREISKKIKALVGTKIGTIVLHASDSIIISAFFGLTMVAKYENYYYIITVLTILTGIFYNSILAGIGNKLETQSEDINYQEFLTLTFVNSWITMFCSTSLLCLYQPFMKIWVGSDLMFDMKMVIGFVSYFYVYQIQKITFTYKDASGIWWEDKFRPYVVMCTNVVGNLLFSYFIGIYGVILSTVISMIISIPWSNNILLNAVFSGRKKIYYKKLLMYVLCSTVACLFTWCMCSLVTMEGFGEVGIKAIICLVVPNVIYLVAFRKTKENKQIVDLMLRIIKGEHR